MLKPLMLVSSVTEILFGLMTLIGLSHGLVQHDDAERISSTAAIPMSADSRSRLWRMPNTTTEVSMSDDQQAILSWGRPSP